MKKILTYTFVLALLTGISSCDKYLELKPQDGIIREEFWKTKEQVHSAVIGIYASLLGTPGDRSLAEYFFIWGEGRADMAVPAGTGTSDELDLLNVNILPTNSLTNWRAVYRTINYCNTVINFAPEVLQNDKTFTQEKLDAYIAEATTIRALMYFYLVRSFGDVPLKLTATSSDQDITNLPATKRADILNQIVNDLKAAEPKAVTDHGSRAANKGRITQYTVNALLADVYLWMDRYEDALAACDKIISSGQFGLVQGTSSWFQTLYANGNSSESIFEFQFDQQKLNPFYNMFTTSRRTWAASFRVMEEFYTIDLLDANNKDIRGEGASVRSLDGAIWKFIGFDDNTLKAADQSFTHWIVYRYADVLMMKAEALNELGRGQEALDIVYTVRNRARALAATDLNPGPDDNDAVADFILAERAREFSFEGKRWYDILRFSKRDSYRRKTILLDMVSESAPTDRQQSAITKYQDTLSHYFPIYFYEIQTNVLLKQNPFYE
ncbi:MAG: RagB/SusD family nutrient uptake outer membrane protein [Chitinophagaceae bacterium]